MTDKNLHNDKAPAKVRLIIEIEIERGSENSRDGQPIGTDRRQRPIAKPIKTRRSIDF